MDFWDRVVVAAISLGVGAIVWLIVYTLLTPNTSEPDTQVCTMVGNVAICGDN